MIWKHDQKLRRGLYWCLKRPDRHPDTISRVNLYKKIRDLDPRLPVERLDRLLRFARDHVPYYRDLLAECDAPLDRFSRIPILEKEMVWDNLERLLADDLAARDWYFKSTGGSTGIPQQFVLDREFQLWERAASTYFFREFIGVDYINVPTVRFWKINSDPPYSEWSLPFKAKMWLKGKVTLNSMILTRRAMESYVHIINKLKPVVIRGYSAAMFRVAQFIKEKNLRVHSPRFICNNADKLHPHVREILEDVFKAKVFDLYATKEVGPIGGTCGKDTLHLFPFNVKVEVVDREGAPVPTGESGRIIVTNLHNLAMPLLRYDTGDLGALGGECSCDSPLPAIKELQGRTMSQFKTREGTMVHGSLMMGLLNRPWVREYYILQEDFDRFQIQFVRKKTPVEANVEEIHQKIRALFGKDCRIDWQEVDEIPLTGGGKLMFTKSLVAD